jgi:hypothetical protein
MRLYQSKSPYCDWECFSQNSPSIVLLITRIHSSNKKYYIYFQVNLPYILSHNFDTDNFCTEMYFLKNEA